MNKRKWRPTSKSRKRNLKYSNSKNIRGWNRANENFEIAITEKKIGKAGHVYVFFVGESGKDKLYKIGCTTNIEKRLQALRASNPFLKCVWSTYVKNMKHLEKRLHRLVRESCIDREIFKLTDKQLMHINNYTNSYHERNS